MSTPIQWPGATYGSGTGTPYTSPNGDTWIWTGYSWEGLIATATPSAGTVYTKELISGGASWNSGMIFDVSNLTYTFYGPIQTANATQVTLNNGDLTNDRIDAIVVNDDDPSGEISIIEGTPSPNPLTPEIPSDQLLIQYVIVPAGAVTLPISQLVIYDDNTEWTGTVIDNGGAGTFTFNSTTPTPWNSSVCLDVTGNSRRRWARFTEPTLSSVTASNYALLSFRVYFPTSISTSRNLTVRFRYNNAYIGTSVVTMPTFASRSVTDQWQNVVIPISLFNIPSVFDSIDFIMSGSNSTNLANWSIDLVQLQNGIAPSVGSGSSPKPWGIYGQGTGVLTTYNSFQQALSASVSGDCIQLFGNVTEVITSPYTIVRKTINLNGHTWYMKGSTSLNDSVIKSERTVGIYNGNIEVDPLSNLVGPNSGIIRVDGVGIFDGLTVFNRSATGSALVTASGRTINIAGGYFQSFGSHAVWIVTPSTGSRVRDIECVTNAANCNGFYSTAGGPCEYVNIKGYSVESSGYGSGIYIASGSERVSDCYGYSFAEGVSGTASYGMYVNGKWEIVNCYGFNGADGTNCNGLYLSSISRNCVGRGTRIGVVLNGGSHSQFTSSGVIGTYFLNSSEVNDSTNTGGYAVYVKEDKIASLRNCTIKGNVLGETGSNFGLTNCTIDNNGEEIDLVEIGPKGLSADSNFFINSVFVCTGATYGIVSTGATARDAGIVNCTFIGPTDSWDTSTINNIISIPSAIDSQGNIKYPS